MGNFFVVPARVAFASFLFVARYVHGSEQH